MLFLLQRTIGYVPKSRRSAVATISFYADTTFEATTPLTLTLQKGLVCTSASSFEGTSYTYNILDPVTEPVVNNIASFDSITVYEGTYLTQTFAVDANNPNQKFILTNPNIDTSSIRVSVRNTQNSTVTRKFTLADNLIGINASSKVFFIQEIEDQRYELIFGDGVFGVKLDNLNYIEVSYVTTNGKYGNGISDFTYSGRILDNNGTPITTSISVLTTDVSSNNDKKLNL